MSSTPEQPRRRGRPPGSGGPRLAPDERAELVHMRVAGEARRAKLTRLGRAWLEAAIDRAKESA